MLLAAATVLAMEVAVARGFTALWATELMARRTSRNDGGWKRCQG